MTASSIIRLNPNPADFGTSADDLDAADFESDVPLQHTHSDFEDDEIGLYVGVWDTGTMIESGGRYSCDEFMWLLEGECQIRDNATGDFETVTAGTAFVIPKGYDCQWQQEGYLRKFYFISDHPDEDIPDAPANAGVVIPQIEATTTPLAERSPFSITAGTGPRQHVCYEDKTGRFTAGTWVADEFESKLSNFPHYMMGIVREGTLRLKTEGGDTDEFNTGDAFLIPKGAICSATVTDTVRLFFTALKAD